MPGKSLLCNPGRAVRGILALVLASGAGFGAGHWAGAQEARPVGLQPLLSTGQTVVGEPLFYPAGRRPHVSAVVVTLAPGAETGWHTHGAPTFGYILEGEVSVTYAGHGMKTYRAGEAIMEAMGTAHNGVNSGPGPVRILAVTMGAEGIAPSRPAPVPQQ